jgi:outer membrane biosynthesis protein TonB
VGKAYRNLLAWVIKAAGYEATPAEEMDFQKETADPAADPKPTTKAPPSTPRPTEKPKDKPTPEPMPPYMEYKGREGEYPLPSVLHFSGAKVVKDIPQAKLENTIEWATKNGYVDLCLACQEYTLPF